VVDVVVDITVGDKKVPAFCGNPEITPAEFIEIPEGKFESE
jgi:hypothetical protein